MGKPTDEELKQAFKDFKEMRDKKRKPLTVRALNGVIKKLNGLSKDVSEQNN